MADDPKSELHLPHYPSSPHVHVASREQQKPMLKMLGRMVSQMKKLPGKVTKLPGKTRPAGKKGLQSRQTIEIRHKQIFY